MTASSSVADIAIFKRYSVGVHLRSLNLRSKCPFLLRQPWSKDLAPDI